MSIDYAFLDWAVDRGLRLNGIVWPSADEATGERGVAAANKVDKDAILLSVPRKLMLTPQFAREDLKAFGIIGGDNDNDNDELARLVLDEDFVALAVWLVFRMCLENVQSDADDHQFIGSELREKIKELEQKMGGGSSGSDDDDDDAVVAIEDSWAPYLRVLPKMKDMQLLPILWNRCDRESLGSALLVDEVAFTVQSAISEMDILCKYVQKVREENSPGPKQQLFARRFSCCKYLWARCCIHTRNMMDGLACDDCDIFSVATVVVPMADMLNHRCVNDGLECVAEWTSSDDGDWYHLRASRDLQPGEAVEISYGDDETSTELLVSHGFLPSVGSLPLCEAYSFVLPTLEECSKLVDWPWNPSIHKKLRSNALENMGILLSSKFENRPVMLLPHPRNTQLEYSPIRVMRALLLLEKQAPVSATEEEYERVAKVLLQKLIKQERERLLAVRQIKSSHEHIARALQQLWEIQDACLEHACI